VNETLKQAFLDTRDGYSADRVVADPVFNAKFLARCGELGLTAPPAELNLRLINSRKSGALSGLPRGKQTSFSNEDEYRFAAEVAARFLEQRDQTSLDAVICNPGLAAEFDSIAQRIAPGYISLQYRWAALNLRKARVLRPEILGQAIPVETSHIGPIESINVGSLSATQGIYLFYSRDSILYVGETTNFRKRIGKHLDHSDNKELARWFWENGVEDVELEIRVLPADTTTRVRRALETELIRSREPRFNIRQR
jgi:hypothetical protein